MTELLNALKQPVKGTGLAGSQGEQKVRIEFPPRVKYNVKMMQKIPAMTFWFTPRNQTVSFLLEVPVGSWLSIGWGHHMFEVDMVVAQAYPDIRRSTVSDLWSIKNDTPLFDTVDNYINVGVERDPEKDDVQIFFMQREMNTKDELDYVIQMNKDLKICYAYNPTTADFIQNTEWGLFSIRYNSDGTTVVGPISTGHNNFIFHGIVMYFCWFIFGFFLLYSKRYTRLNWKLMHVLHIVLGTLVFVVSTYFSLMIIRHFAWHVHPDYHQILGVVTIGIIIFCSLAGIIVTLMMHFYNGDKPWQDYDTARHYSAIHRWSGYLTLLLANASCMLGIINYVQKQIKQPEKTWWILFTLPLFTLIVVAFEVYDRVYQRKGKLSFIMPKNMPLMTIDDFHQNIKSGKNLVVIDNLILEQTNYAHLHPGGKFSIRKTMGRDISKYFYGGFSLLDPKVGRPPYRHSLKALSVAQSMVVAVVAGQENFGEDIITRIIKKSKLGDNNSTFVFETIDKRAVPNFSNFFDDLQCIGRHYLICASSDPIILRQYTVCNTFIPELYKELFKLCQSVLMDETPTFDRSNLVGGPTNRVHLTLKNYKYPTGLSSKIHAQKVTAGETFANLEHCEDSIDEKAADALTMYKTKEPTVESAKTVKTKNNKYVLMHETFAIKGPFGKGLSIKPTGVHIAFAAGTGVLVFLDLVTRIILHNTGIKSLGHDFDEDFKFVFFISHQNIKETMGMDLCLKLMEINKKLKINNFELNVRLTEGRDGIYGQKAERWTPKMLKKQLMQYVPNIARIYICGPPLFNQTFDIAFEKIKQDLMISMDMIEVL